MATTSPTPNYSWVLPVPGGSIGAWGTMLRKVFADDAAPLGIDAVLKAIQDDVDTAETDIAALDTRVDTLEAAGSSAYYARLYRSGNQTIPSSTLTQVAYNAESFDQGGLSSSGPAITVPASAAGVYQVRAQVLVPFHVSGDDSRLWRMEIHKDGTKVAEANTPSLNDGVSSGSGNISLSAAYLDATAVEGTIYTVHVYNGSGSAALQGGAGSSFLEAVRLIAA